MEIQKPTHSPLGASSYYRWKACPGSVRLCRGLKGQESQYARIGTLAHEYAADVLTKGQDNAVRSKELTDEDVLAVNIYVNFVTKLMNSPDLKNKDHFSIEKKFDLSQVFPMLYGTADCVIYFEGADKLMVIDYKHGAGLPVEVAGNRQLMYYGLGALLDLGVAVRSIELVVVQPRCFHPDGPIRSWQTTPEVMLEFAGDLADDALATEDPNAPLSPGDHCRFCPAMAMHCPAVREKSLSAAKQVFDTVSSYDPKKLSQTLEMLPVMEAWVKSVREFAYREAQHGRKIPGFKMVEKRANRKWIKPFEADFVAKEFGLRPPDCLDQKLKSPAQMEKLIPKSLKERLDKMVIQESSGASLVHESDPRPELKNNAANHFTMIED